jgi:hypothetical protein
MKFKLSVLTVVALMVQSASVIAQLPDLVLVHGFKSGPYTWTVNETAQTLQADLSVNSVATPSYDWTQHIYQTAPSLPIASPSNSILIGHSEGGILSRYRAQIEPVTGVLTIGSPNLGANMADNYHAFLAHVAYTAGAAGMMNRNMWALDPPWWMNLLDTLYDIFTWVFGTLLYLPDMVGAVVPIFVPVVQDLGPASSTFIGNLNGNLATEQANAPLRASIAYEMSDYEVAPEWRLFLGNALGRDMGDVEQVMSGYAYAVAYEAESEMSDLAACDCDDDRFWALWDLEDDSFFFANNLWQLDSQWCWDISMTNAEYWNAPYLTCRPSDGFIRTLDQAMPGVIPIPGSLATIHTEETGRATEDIEPALVNVFNLIRR